MSKQYLAENESENEWTVTDTHTDEVVTVFCNQNNNNEKGAIDCFIRAKAEEERIPTEEEIKSRKLESFRGSAEVSEFQAKAALMQSGLLQDTLAYIDQADEMTKLAWETARVFKRSSHLISEVAESLGLTPEQMDDIFRFAMTIEV